MEEKERKGGERMDTNYRFVLQDHLANRITHHSSMDGPQRPMTSGLPKYCYQVSSLWIHN